MRLVDLDQYRCNDCLSGKVRWKVVLPLTWLDLLSLLALARNWASEGLDARSDFPCACSQPCLKLAWHKVLAEKCLIEAAFNDY